jgi:hypothetical protein
MYLIGVQLIPCYCSSAPVTVFHFHDKYIKAAAAVAVVAVVVVVVVVVAAAAVVLHFMTVAMFTWNLHIMYNSQHVLYPTAVTISG